jgi:hypothetical protein
MSTGFLGCTCLILAFVLLGSCASRPPALPAIIAGDAISLRQGLDAAVKSGARQVVIPPGTYVLPATKPGSYHLVVDGASDLTIEATGVTLVFTGRDQHSLSLRNCRRVTWHGGTLQRATIPFSQGRIERLEENGAFLVVRIDPGYPQDIDNLTLFPNFWTNVIAADGSGWQAHYRGVTPPEISRLGPDLLRVRMSHQPADVPVPLTPGTSLVWRGAVFDDVEVRASRDCVISGVTVAGGSGMCFHERGGGGNTYRDCVVTYPPRPVGAQRDPLMSSCADGFHSSGAHGGPVIERCSFTATDDDAIAIHGTYAMVMEASASTLVAWRVRHEENALYAAPGQTIRFYDERGARAGEAVVTAVQVLPDYHPTQLPEAGFRYFQDPTKGVFLAITCDRPVSCKLNWLISNPEYAGSDYVIRDCVIRDGFARGILPKGARGLIEGNTIERTARAGIELIPELYFWSENDYSTDLVIRNNLLHAVNRNRQRGDLRHPGALTAFAFRNGAYVPFPGGHRNLQISGNTFSACQGPNILLISSQGVRIENNRFLQPMTVPSTFGQDKGVDPTALIWASESGDISSSGNRIEGAGAGMQSIVGTAASVRNSSGLAAGFSGVQP